MELVHVHDKDKVTARREEHEPVSMGRFLRFSLCGNQVCVQAGIDIPAADHDTDFFVLKFIRIQN